MMAAPTTSAPAQSLPVPLCLPNLLNDFTQLVSLLDGELKQGSWLNAYLLAAGMNQIVDDFLHRDPYASTKVAKILAPVRKPFGPLAATAARSIGALAWRVRNHRAETLRLLGWQTDLVALLAGLADLVASDALPNTPRRTELLETGNALLASIRRLPARLLCDVVRLPACFRTFDQHPSDLERLIAEFAQRWPDRRRPVVVVGLRTSGSYLAPLLAAFLRALGYQSVRVFSWRKGQRWLRSERFGLRAVVAAGGLTLLTDDPPSSGGQLSLAAREMEALGFPAQSIVLLLQLFGSRGSLPAVLQQYPSVLLPWEDWTIHERLAPPAVRRAITEMLSAGCSVGETRRLPLPAPPPLRGHAYALYRIQLTEVGTGKLSELQVFVKGVGLGYFGEYSLAIERRLRRFLPRVYGL